MTTEEVYNEIIQEKESGNYPALSEFTSSSNPSKVSIWQRWIHLFSFFSASLKKTFESLKAEIIKIFSESQPGTLHWWISEIKRFQYGDTLVFSDGIFKYTEINADKNIVKQVALENISGIILFKVASEDSEENLLPLDISQKEALASFISKIKFPDTRFSVLSTEADDIKLIYRFYYDPQTDSETIDIEALNVAKNYAANVVFNGEFILTELTDEFQKITNVKNPVHKEAYIKTHFEAEVQYRLIEDSATAASGWFNIDKLEIEFITDV